MAYVKDISTILDKMKEMDIRCYTISEPDGKLLDENDNQELSAVEAREKFEMMMDSLIGTVKVTLRTNSKKARANGQGLKDNHYYLIRLRGENESGVNGMGNSNTSIYGLMEKNFNTQIEMIKKETQWKQDLEDLKKSIKEDNGGYEVVKDILKELKPYLPMIAAKFNQAPITPGIAGNANDVIEDIPKNKYTAEEMQRMETAVSKLMKLDANFVSNIEKLAEFCERFNDDYVSIIPMLDFKLQQPKK